MQQSSKAKMQWPRRRPHGNEHNEWRSRRSRPDMTLARNEYAAKLAVAAFMKKTHERNIVSK
jgi:hypothetical protein